MFGFLKRLGSQEPANNNNTSTNNDSSLDQSYTQAAKDYYWENKKLTEFLLTNYPKLSQKRFLYYQQKEFQEEEGIDVSVFFDEKDKYLANEHDQSKIFFTEFRYLPKEDLRVEDVMARVEVLEKYNKRINEKVQKSATKNYDKFQGGISNLDFFQKTVAQCREDIRESREILNTFRNDLAQSSLKIIELFKEKVNKQKALDFLVKFREDFGGIYKVINALDNEDFTHAYEIIPIIKRAKAEFDKSNTMAEQFACLKNAHSYLDGKLELLSQNVRNGLENIFTEWNEPKFEALLKCHYMLEQHTTTMPYLVNELESIMKNSIKIARKNVIKHFSKQAFQMRTETTFLKPKEFASILQRDVYAKFMNRIFHEMSLLMYNNHLSTRYLEDKAMANIEIVLEDKTRYNLREYFSTLAATTLKLRKVIWQTIQKKVAKLLVSTHICEFSYNELVDFMEFCNIFVEIGEDFSNSSSKLFCDTLLERLKEYYNHFHQNHLNNIKSVLATEEWKRLPLPRNYKQQSLLNLLAQFPNVQQKVRAIFRSSKSNVIESLSLDDIKKLNSPLTSFVSGNPFKLENNLKPSKSYSRMISAKIADTSIDEMNEDEKTFLSSAESLSNVDEEKDNDVVVCATANFIVKNFEKYLLLMDLIRPYSLEIFTSMLYSFEYYIYAVVTTYVPPQYRNALCGDVNLDNLNNFKDDDMRMVALENAHDIFLFQNSYRNLKAFLPRIVDYFENSLTNMKIEPNASIGGNVLFDLGERTIATEAMLFAYTHLKYVQNRVTKIITDPGELDVVINYYQSYEKIIPEMRSFIYACFMPSLIKNDNFFQSIQNVKWEIKETSELSNIYIDRVVYFVKDFREKIQCLSGGAIPQQVQNDLNKDVVNFTFRQLTDNYSKIRKINAAGRNMMLQDFYAIIQGLDGLIDPRCNEKKESTEKFITAWHMNAEDLTQFVLDNKNTYALRQLNLLLNSSNAINNLKKNSKKELFAKIEKEFIEFIRNGL